MPAPNEISVNQLMRLIGTPDAPTIVDVCIDEDFAADPRLLPGSVRHSHKDMPALAAVLDKQHVVIVCQKGKKLSQGVVAWLRTQGMNAEYLAGGHHAWRDAGAPLIPASALPAPVNGSTLWVTRHRPKIDRIACPWLIRRFIDEKAQFLFVSPSEVLGVAEKFGATPFDVEDVHFSHRDENCTFDTMLTEFALETEPLLRLANVVRGADTNRHDLTPESAGLLALSVGLSRQYKDDTEQLNAGMALYDALYRWARDGYEEGHDWPTGKR
ncbi:chromate resistance protein ChrB domain-containing protein [Pseudohalocynthiibacter aestuariivivens]|jgi:rhodanese-related sulfurtransferase|uniref:Chromate resistance protein ChrB domain-containing protein n=1 Tax=Pseudohalocynthiibacter aestuariivivens TaxID=1591409 RepID=A0ABV5JGU4_9RHOB|nr:MULTISPECIES: sulfurtransferase/chromate resistance protein [Pseudohalocynthiibacter]MBS9718733.1 chromate resistance protein [Pseudohalocynthiibacter aestuariivivens]MCK0104352.1 sulfurtransferase/chromate resistance protein [Pseudohalocynthiibacter sp. F2068]